ncbi:Protein S-acyltransferase [Bertholletia excelsa]
MHRGGPPPPHCPNSNRQVLEIDNNDSAPRLYQVWKGNNRFFLGGRLIFGPDFRSLFLTMSLILVPVIFFCMFVCEGLIDKFPQHLGHLIVVLSSAFTAYIFVLLIITSGTDPGIIPRNSCPPDTDDDVSSMSTEWAGSQNGVYNLPPIKEVMINGMIVRVKYCQTCMLYRPPRCSHCSICNNCVEHFDHHCPWVGQCIGKRNYRFFLMFVSSTTVLCLYVFALCWLHVRDLMVSYHYNLWKAFMKSPVSGILIMYTFITSWFLGGLTAFHLYLMATNQTTYENFRNHYDRKRNPYNVGCARNFREILFAKLSKPKIDFRAEVKSDPYGMFSSRSTSLSQLKSSCDVEIRNRQTVTAEEVDDIQRRIESLHQLERCGTQSINHCDRKSYRESTSNPHLVNPEIGEDHGDGDRKKTGGNQ